MFNFFKKYLLIVIFLGLIPSAYAMENNQKYSWPLNAIAGLWSRMPSIPSKLFGWNIRKEAKAEKQKNAKHIENKKPPQAENTTIAMSAIFAYIYRQKANIIIWSIISSLDENFPKPKKEDQKVIDIFWKAINKYLPFANNDITVQYGSLYIKTPLLSHAVKHKQKDTVNYLLQRNANPNDKLDWNTPLQRILIYLQNSKDDAAMIILKKLLEYGADPNMADMGYIPLELAIAKGDKNVDVVKLLIEYNANVNARNRKGEPLLGSDKIYYSYPQIIKEFCNAGADVTTKNEYGYTVLQSIADTKDVESIKAILTHAQFNSKQTNKDQEATVMEIILTLKYLGIPNDLQCEILLALPVDSYFYNTKKIPFPRDPYFYNTNGILFKKLYHDNKKFYVLALAKSQITQLVELLQQKTEQGKNTSQLFHEYWVVQDCRDLLDGSQLIKDYNVLRKNPDMLNPNYLLKYPEKTKNVEENLAWQTCNNIIKIQLNNNKAIRHHTKNK